MGRKKELEPFTSELAFPEGCEENLYTIFSIIIPTISRSHPKGKATDIKWLIKKNGINLAVHHARFVRRIKRSSEC